MPIAQPSFIATLTFKTRTEGGRSVPAHSGYRPTIRFPFDTMMTSGQQKYLGKDVVSPGETVEAEITIIAVEYFKEQLYEGLKFEFTEGSRVIGTGTITKILNKRLQRP